MTYLRFPTYDGASLARRSDQIAGFSIVSSKRYIILGAFRPRS